MTTLAPKQGHDAYRASWSAAALLGVALLTAALGARSQVVEIAWKDGNQFDRSVTVAPAKFAEFCGPLGAGKTVAWSFDADGELDFNIHYHAGKQVRYPSRAERVRRSAGELTVDLAQDYCWMWTNTSAAPAKVDLRLVLK